MSERPQLKLKLGPADIMLEMLGSLAILALWGLVISHYSSLPDSIPVHFNAEGLPDRFGGKANLFLVPIMSTFTFFGLTFLNRFPEIFNYPVEITGVSALVQYRNMTRMIRYLKMILVVIFGFIVFKNIQVAYGNQEGLGDWFLPIALAFLFLPLIYFISNSFRINKKLQSK
ncbi:DUF1648 domain-containing protein [Algoriphagus ratkowskyi]|nr:DUF1648 domain-containing protein [Algoriphagus ratkowskyi]TXD76521.1 DUF1648 domain-containing protein [Algoriphagus ratkowskyi]